MERLAQFYCTFFKLQLDRDGQTRVIFDVPLSDIPEVMKLSLGLETTLLVTVEKEESGGMSHV